MVFKEGVEELNVFKFNVDHFNYNIFVSSDADVKCFKWVKISLVWACREWHSEPSVSEQPGQDTAEQAGVDPLAATVWPAAESPGGEQAPSSACSPEATPASEKPCSSEPVPVRPRSADWTLERSSDTKPNQEKASSAKPQRERTCSVDSGTVPELLLGKTSHYTSTGTRGRRGDG